MARIIQSVSLDLQSAAFADAQDNFSAFVRMCIRYHEQFERIDRIHRASLMWEYTAKRMDVLGEDYMVALSNARGLIEGLESLEFENAKAKDAHLMQPLG